MYRPIILVLFMLVDFTLSSEAEKNHPVKLWFCTTYDERVLNISSDGLTLYLVSNNPSGYGGEDLWISRRNSVNAEWRQPENLGEKINSNKNEWAVSISSDEKTLYFVSDRENGEGGWDIWFSERESKLSEWKKPKNIGRMINTEKNENNPFIAADDLTLYFSDSSGSAPRDGGFGKADIWVSKRTGPGARWENPVNLGGTINGTSNEVHPFLSFDELLLFFSSDRAGGFGMRDIWYSVRDSKTDAWSAPKNIGSMVNSERNEYELCVTSSGQEVYFTSNRDGGMDIFRVKVSSVKEIVK